MRRLFAGAAAACTAAALLTSCREHGRPDPSIRMAISHQRAAEEGAEPARTPGAAAEGAPDVPTRLEVPPEVERAWGGIRLSWTDKSNGKTGTLDVPLGGSAALPDSALTVRADVFLPAFSMKGGTITSEGVEAQNPAARIAVSEKGQEIFAGWIFTRFPDVHPFTHARFQLHLEGGVPKAAP